MDEQKKGWEQFQNIQLDHKRLSSRARQLETQSMRHANRFIVKRLGRVRSVQREITIWLMLVCAIIAGMGVQLLLGQGQYQTTAFTKEGSYVEATVGSIDTLNPIYAMSNAESSAGRLMFSSLYSYDDTGTIHQDLATGMQVDPTGKIYTVSLRRNAKWHDGKPLTSRDVVYTVNIIKNPAARSPLRINWLDVSAKAIDPYTVQFTLPAQYAAFSHALNFPVLPLHILASVNPSALRENTFSQAPVGSGPFKFRLLQSTDSVNNRKTVHMVANDSYHFGRPKLDRFEVQVFPQKDDVIKALRTGQVSGAADVSITSRSSINTSLYNVTPLPVASGVYLLMNTTNPLLGEHKIRQALQAATNTEEIRKALGDGLLPLDLPFTHSLIEGDDIPRAPAPNLERAGALLDEAGWPLGANNVREREGKPLEITITAPKTNDFAKALEVVIKQWESIGVKATARQVDTTSVTSTFILDTLQNRNFDVLLYELVIGADADVYAYWHSSQARPTGYNFSNYSNKTADADLASARGRVDAKLRNIKYTQFARQWLADAPAIGLYQPVIAYVSTKNSSTVLPSSQLVTSVDRYSNILDWSVTQEHVYRTP